MLIGNNGIINQASNAKKQTEISQEKESIDLAITDAQIKSTGYQELNYTNLQTAISKQFGNKAIVSDNGNGTFTVSLRDTLRDYNITSNGIEYIDWNEKFENATVHPNQSKKDVIGLDSNGNSVNMDLWKFTKLEDNTYSLNYRDSTEYIYFNNGKIIGEIPCYIKETGQTFYAVTSLLEAFINCDELVIAPQIPHTVTNMQGTFKNCTSLKECSIPSSVTNLLATFQNCESLEKAPVIPNFVIDMGWTFRGCINLKSAPIIPETVTNMKQTFGACTNLINGSNIPKNVTNIQWTYQDCINLRGFISINANVSGIIVNNYIDFYQCFYGATLKENNIELNIYLKESTYSLFKNDIKNLYNSEISNINLLKQ